MMFKMDLLDVLTIHAKCDYLSDLKHLNNQQKMRPTHALAKIPADAAVLKEWNDALEYLTGAQPCDNAEQARAALIAGLSEV